MMRSQVGRGTVPRKYTVREAFEAIDTYRTWGASTKTQYKSRLLKLLRAVNVIYENATLDDMYKVDLIKLLKSPDALTRAKERIVAQSKAPGVFKDYLSPLVGLLQKAAAETLGKALPGKVQEFAEQTMKDMMGVRSVADAKRSLTDDGHEPYENIMAAAKWVRARKLLDQRALMVSLYGDNPILVRDNYGDVKMFYGEAAQRAHNVPAVDPENDSYYDVRTGRLFITRFKTRARGYRPYDILVNKHTKAIVDGQLAQARRRGDDAWGYRHWLFTSPSDPRKPIGKLGKNSEIDKALRSTGVGFQLKAPKTIGPNVLRSSYVTYRVNLPGVTSDELIMLARDMKHSFAVQQLVYKRQTEQEGTSSSSRKRPRREV